MNPPLRTEEDLESILAGLRDGTIDVIASDHAPHSIEEKDVEFSAAPFGILGLQTMLGLTLGKLVQPGVLSLERSSDENDRRAAAGVASACPQDRRSAAG